MKLKNEVEDFDPDFDGIFRFTNASDEDFTTPWNNVEYTYPAGQTVPMIIKNSSIEEVQQIRKYFAKRLAEREYFRTKGFRDIRNGLKNKDMGRNVIPTSYNEKELQPYIDSCLKPLPAGKAKVHKLPTEDLPVKVSKPIGKGSVDGSQYPSVDLNETFKESNEEMLKSR